MEIELPIDINQVTEPVIDNTSVKIDHKIKNISQILYKKGEHKSITDNVVMMLSSNYQPYYAEFLIFMNYFESTNIPTMGVNISKYGMNFYWNRKFIDKLLPTELLFIMIHECFHLLFDHTKRSIFYNKEISNIAQDMIINSIIVEDIVKKQNPKTQIRISLPKYNDEFQLDENGIIILDKDGNKIKNHMFNKNMGLYLPKEYTGEPIFENLYGWLKEEYKDYKDRKDNKGESDQNNGGMQDKQGLDSFGKPNYGQNGQNGIDCHSLDSIFDSFDKGEQLTLDNHIEDEVSSDARKSIVNDLIQRLKNRGLVSGDIESTLNKLRKSKINYLKEIKRVTSNHIIGSSKRKSITRPNRRGMEGIKGKKKFKNLINCILDTSGSMSNEFERVLSYIFQNDIQINLIQIDTSVKSVNLIKNKRDLQNLNIKGLGGTILMPAIDYISDPKNKISKYNTIILTDGGTDKLDFSETKCKVLILSTSCSPPINDPKGLTKIILIDLKESLHSN